jgi:hypothetical protein
MKIERTSDGKIELRLSGDSEHFKRLANAVREILDGQWIEQIDSFDQSYWDLDVQGRKITLHREHYLGVSVFCNDEAPLRSLLEQLQRTFEDIELRPDLKEGAGA